MHIPCFDLKVLPLHVGESIRGVHGKRELELGFPTLEDLYESRKPLRPNRASEDFDEELLLEERVADVRALFDVLRCLLREFLQAVPQHFAIQADMGLRLNASEPAVRALEKNDDDLESYQTY